MAFHSKKRNIFKGIALALTREKLMNADTQAYIEFIACLSIFFEGTRISNLSIQAIPLVLTP